MSPRNMFFFFQLSALRIANLPSGSRSLGTYRTLVRQYAEEFGIRAEIETADDPMLAALESFFGKRDTCSSTSGLTGTAGPTALATPISTRLLAVADSACALLPKAKNCSQKWNLKSNRNSQSRAATSVFTLRSKKDSGSYGDKELAGSLGQPAGVRIAVSADCP